MDCVEFTDTSKCTDIPISREILKSRDVFNQSEAFFDYEWTRKCVDITQLCFLKKPEMTMLLSKWQI
jgi:hypothetical protein